MEFKAIEEYLKEVTSLQFQQQLYPFPSADCKKLFSTSESEFREFTTYLDLYFIDITGCYANKRDFLDWPKSKLSETKRALEKSFFERYSQFREIEGRISSKDTPKLYLVLSSYEKLRSALSNAVSALIKEKDQDQDTSL